MSEGLRIKVGADIIEFTRSINQVEQEIKDLSKSIKGLSGQDLVRANKELDKLNETAQRLRNVGKQGFDQFGVALSRIGPTAAGAVPALNSLGQVARDLPFGFIAIQNNLPIVLDQFSELSRQSGGTGAALKALGASLLGPAGLTFAFGAAVAGVTSLIQKYGSLGNAITELAANQDAAAVAQRKLNGEIANAVSGQNGEIQTLQNLVAAINDQNKSQLERSNAYRALVKEFPGVIQNLSKENALTAQGGQLIAERSKQLISYINLKAKENALIKLGEEATKQQLEAAKAGIDNLNNQNTVLNKLINSIVGAGDASRGFAIRLGQNSKDFDKAGQNADFFNQALKEVQAELLKFDPDLTGLQKVNKEIEKGAKVKGTINVKVDRGVFDFATVEVDKNNTALNKALEDFRKQTISNTGLDIPLKLTIPQASFDALRKIGEDKSLAFLQEKTKAITTQFNDFLAPAIDTAFGALANGQNIGQALAQSFKALLVQLTATVVKALALKAILAALNLGTGGIAGIVGSAIGAVSGIGAGFSVNPNFGGLSGGGLQLGGSVNLSVRGTDLVGAINGANSQIRRVS